MPIKGNTIEDTPYIGGTSTGMIYLDANGLQKTDGPSYDGSTLKVWDGSSLNDVQANSYVLDTSSAYGLIKSGLGVGIKIASNIDMLLKTDRLAVTQDHYFGWTNSTSADLASSAYTVRLYSNGFGELKITDAQEVLGTLQIGSGIITSQSATSIPLKVEAASAQSANLVEVNSNGGSGGDLFEIDSVGNVRIDVNGNSLRQTTFGDTNCTIGGTVFFKLVDNTNANKPVIAKIGDSTTGIRWPANNELAFSTNGINVLTMDANQTCRFDGSGIFEHASGGVIQLESTDTSLGVAELVGKVSFYANDAASFGTGEKAFIQAEAISSNSIELVFGTSLTNQLAVEQMRLDQYGRLGIRNSNPSAYVDVVNSVASFVGLSVEGAAAQTANLLEINENGETGGSILRVEAGGDIVVSGDVLGASNQVSNFGSNSVRLGTGFFNKMRVGDYQISDSVTGEGVAFNGTGNLDYFARGVQRYFADTNSNDGLVLNRYEWYINTTVATAAADDLVMSVDAVGSMVFTGSGIFEDSIAVSGDLTINGHLGMGTAPHVTWMQDILHPTSNAMIKINTTVSGKSQGHTYYDGGTLKWTVGKITSHVGGLGSNRFAFLYTGQAIPAITLNHDNAVGFGIMNAQAQIHVECDDATTVGAIVEGAAAQSANLLEINENGETGGTVFRVEADGNVAVSGDLTVGVYNPLVWHSFSSNNSLIISKSTLLGSQTNSICLATNNSSVTTANQSIGIGYQVNVTGNRGIAIGQSMTAGQDEIKLGCNSVEYLAFDGAGTATFGGSGIFEDNVATSGDVFATKFRGLGNTSQLGEGTYGFVRTNDFLDNHGVSFGQGGVTKVILRNTELRANSDNIMFLGGPSQRWKTIYGDALDVEARTASDVPVIVEAAAAQTANLLEINENGESGGSLFKIGPNGNVLASGDLTVNGDISTDITGIGAEAFGAGAVAISTDSTAFGKNATCNNVESTAIGADSIVGAYQVAVGSNAEANGGSFSSGRVAIGWNTNAGHNHVVCIGNFAESTAANQFVGGSIYSETSNVYFGKGQINSVPGIYTIHGTATSVVGSGGGVLQLQGGAHTSGTYGDLNIQPYGGLTAIGGDVATSGDLTVTGDVTAENYHLGSDSQFYYGVATTERIQASTIAGGRWIFHVNGYNMVGVLNDNTKLTLQLAEDVILGWSSGGITNSTDLAVSRISAGVAGLGTGLKGAIDGELRLGLIEAGSGVLTAQSATSIPLTIEAASAQSANLVEVNSNGGSGGDLFKVTAAGVLNAAGGVMLDSDSNSGISSPVNNQIQMISGTTAVGGWFAGGTYTTFNYKHYLDTGGNTYLTSDVADQIALFTNGTEAFRVVANNDATFAGNVDIAKGLTVGDTVGVLESGIIFGDGDSGFYEQGDDFLAARAGGSDSCVFYSAGVAGGTGNTFPVMRSIHNTINFTWYGDEDTGHWRSATNQITFVTGSTDVLIMDANQDVSIPNGNLSIGGMSATDVGLSVELASTPTANAFEINSNGGSGGDVLEVQADGDINMGAGGVLKLLASSGTPGHDATIGSNTSGQLTVDTDIRFSSAASKIVNNTGASSYFEVGYNAHTHGVGNWANSSYKGLSLDVASIAHTLDIYDSALLDFTGTISSTGEGIIRGLSTTLTDNSTAKANTIIGVKADVSGGINASAIRIAGQFIGGAVEFVASDSTGKLSRKIVEEVHTLSAAATSDTTTISVPSGARLLGVSFNVNTAVVDSAGDDTWSAAFVTGSTTTLATGSAAAQNTKVDLMLPDEISTGVCQVRFTANGGNFSAGVIEVVVYYETLTSLANA